MIGDGRYATTCTMCPQTVLGKSSHPCPRCGVTICRHCIRRTPRRESDPADALGGFNYLTGVDQIWVCGNCENAAQGSMTCAACGQTATIAQDGVVCPGCSTTREWIPVADYWRLYGEPKPEIPGLDPASATDSPLLQPPRRNPRPSIYPEGMVREDLDE